MMPFIRRAQESAETTLLVFGTRRAFSIRSMVAAKRTSANEDVLDAIVAEHRSKFINTHFIF